MNSKSDFLSEMLTSMAFSKIGEVTEVDGSRLLIKVNSKKNLTNLFYNGVVYRNVGIGSYVKIKKDYSFIVGKISKEFIKDKIKNYNSDSLDESHERYIEVLVVGLFNEGCFVRGIKELPFLYNEAFLMSEYEVKKVFKFTNKHSIEIGMAIFEDVLVEAGISKLFASHIGIFGNTGSGKSNTLTRLYYNLINSNNISLNSSRFILLDFNGEYTNADTITPSKTNIVLSTRNQQDKLKITPEWLDEEFWGIILQATEKTQKPFIKRSLNYLGTMLKVDVDNTLSYIIGILCAKLRSILNSGGITNKEIEAFNILKICIRDFFEIQNETEYKEIFRYYNIGNGALCRQHTIQDENYTVSSGRIFFGSTNQNNVDKELELFRGKLMDLKNQFVGTLYDIKFFELALALRLYEDVLNNTAVFEHVAPIIHRFQRKKRELEKIIQVGAQDFTFDETNPITSISLKDVNTEMKKIIPLLITKKLYDNHKENHNGLNTLHIIIDEAHNILSEDSSRESESWKDYRLEVFEEIIKEGRKFGVFLTLSSQRPSDISNTIISQLHNVFIHRLINNNDLLTMSKTISFLDKASFDSLSILPPGACIFTGTATETPIAVQIPLLEKKYQPMSETIDLESIWFSD
jgi:hypothetical protein